MKKEITIIVIAAVVIFIVGIVAYQVMSGMGYFNDTNSDSASFLGIGGTVLIPAIKYLWDKILQLISLLITIAIAVFIICGIGIILF